jgi:hypothetical protein
MWQKLTYEKTQVKRRVLDGLRGDSTPSFLDHAANEEWAESEERKEPLSHSQRTQNADSSKHNANMPRGVRTTEMGTREGFTRPHPSEEIVASHFSAAGGLLSPTVVTCRLPPKALARLLVPKTRARLLSP